MIYRIEDIYTKIKNDSDCISEAEFINCDNDKIEGKRISAFSDIRLALGQNFKLDHICFLLGNGCSLYAGSKPLTDFNISEVVNVKKLNKLDICPDIVNKLSGKTMEEQLNALLTIQELYAIFNDNKDNDNKKIIATTINDIKSHLLKTYVNSIKYKELNLHEIMLLKLRSFGCLNKVNLYTINYDLALEYILDKYGIEYEDGFSGFVNRKFDPRSLQIAKSTRLVKIHGSINWIFDEKDKIIKEIQPYFSDDGIVKVPDAEHVLIYPTAQKLYQTYNAPYSELMRSMLDNFESQRNVIIVLGYRYADEHINEILFKAIANPNNIFYFFDYDNGSCDFIQKMIKISESIQNINIFLDKFLGDFKTFVKYILPANAEKTDEERIFELLNKVIVKQTGDSHA